jgi:hypothetical protein
MAGTYPCFRRILILTVILHSPNNVVRPLVRPVFLGRSLGTSVSEKQASSSLSQHSPFLGWPCALTFHCKDIYATVTQTFQRSYQFMKPTNSVSISIFRRGYHTLCGGAVVTMLHQQLAERRIHCAISLFMCSARLAQGIYMGRTMSV